MRKEAYIDGVMRRMNELGWDDSLTGMFLGGDTTKVERHVERLFRDAWRGAVALLPRHFFNQGSFKGAQVVFDVSDGTGFVTLPEDFYVLVSFKMEGWKRSCYSAVEEDDLIGSVQSNGFVRGNFCRPVCTLSERVVVSTNGSHQERVLRYYSLPKGVSHYVEEAVYIPLVGAIDGLSDDAELGLREQLYEPLQWLHAGMVFSVFEKGEQAKVAESWALRFA